MFACNHYDALTSHTHLICLRQEHRPLLPTNITAMLKYGVNLLQAVGNFDGMRCLNIYTFCIKATSLNLYIFEKIIYSSVKNAHAIIILV